MPILDSTKVTLGVITLINKKVYIILHLHIVIIVVQFLLIVFTYMHRKS